LKRQQIYAKNYFIYKVKNYLQGKKLTLETVRCYVAVEATADLCQDGAGEEGLITCNK
jgi:hypothetical protein